MQRFDGRPPEMSRSQAHVKAQRRVKGARGKDYAPNNMGVLIALAIAGGFLILPLLLWLAHITG